MADFSLSQLTGVFSEIIGKLPIPRYLRERLEALAETAPERVLADRATQMPVLTAVAAQLGDRPFEGLRVVMVLHFLRDLLYFIGCCRDAGLAPERTLLLFKPYPYMEKEFVRQCLEQWDFQVAAVDDLPAVLTPFLAAGPERVLIIEDGGYVVPLLHRNARDVLPRVRGAVEQTTKGLRNDEQVVAEGGGLLIPVISIAESDIKRDFEPAGVAEALWNNVRQLAHDVMWRGSVVLVVGYGTIGRALAHRIRATEATVLVYDERVYRRALARHEGFETVDALVSGLQRQSVKLIIGTTGTQSLTAEHLALVRNGTYLASASSDRIEIAVDHLEGTCHCEQVGDGCARYTFPDQRVVYLLAEGYPVNFYAADSVQNQLIDLIMTQIFLAACELARNGPDHAPGIDRDAVNELSVRARLIDIFYATHFAN